MWISIESICYIGTIPLTIIAIVIIGWMTPENIIKNTIESWKPTKNTYSIVSNLDFIFGLILCCLGGFFVILDTIINNNGNFRGYSLISIGLILFAYSLTLKQTQIDMDFIKNVQDKIRLVIKLPKKIETHNKIKIKLYISRFLLLIGFAVSIIGCVIFGLDNIPDFSGQFRAIVVIGIGFAIMSFAVTFQRTTISSIVQPQILNKLDAI